MVLIVCFHFGVRYTEYIWYTDLIEHNTSVLNKNDKAVRVTTLIYNVGTVRVK